MPATYTFDVVATFKGDKVSFTVDAATLALAVEAARVAGKDYLGIPEYPSVEVTQQATQ